MNTPVLKPWHEFLDEEELAFIKRFLLSSGSLKDLAAAYGVSYPTVRLRLDRLIEKIKILESHRNEDDYERLLRTLYAEQKMDGATFRRLLQIYREQKGNHHEKASAD